MKKFNFTTSTPPRVSLKSKKFTDQIIIPWGLEILKSIISSLKYFMLWRYLYTLPTQRVRIPTGSGFLTKTSLVLYSYTVRPKFEIMHSQWIENIEKTSTYIDTFREAIRPSQYKGTYGTFLNFCRRAKTSFFYVMRTWLTQVLKINSPRRPISDRIHNCSTLDSRITSCNFGVRLAQRVINVIIQCWYVDHLCICKIKITQRRMNIIKWIGR